MLLLISLDPTGGSLDPARRASCIRRPSEVPPSAAAISAHDWPSVRRSGPACISFRAQPLPHLAEQLVPGDDPARGRSVASEIQLVYRRGIDAPCIAPVRLLRSVQQRPAYCAPCPPATRAISQAVRDRSVRKLLGRKNSPSRTDKYPSSREPRQRLGSVSRSRISRRTSGSYCRTKSSAACSSPARMRLRKSAKLSACDMASDPGLRPANILAQPKQVRQQGATDTIEKSVKVWDAETGKAVLTLAGHTAWGSAQSTRTTRQRPRGDWLSLAQSLEHLESLRPSPPSCWSSPGDAARSLH